MDGDKRRERIIELLKNSDKPLAGTVLAGILGVSRQVIVTDITLLRASGERILSTYKGYIMQGEDLKYRKVKVRHSDDEILEELYTIVDAGGKTLDVGVSHGIYGEIKAELLLSSRKDVDEFSKLMKSGQISPLKNLTDDYHYHTIAGETEELLDFIEEQLNEKGYLSK